MPNKTRKLINGKPKKAHRRLHKKRFIVSFIGSYDGSKVDSTVYHVPNTCYIVESSFKGQFARNPHKFSQQTFEFKEKAIEYAKNLVSTFSPEFTTKEKIER